MNCVRGAVVCCTFLSVCSFAASAESITITGNVSFTQDSLTFAPPFATGDATGNLSSYAGGTVNYELGTVSYIYGIPQTEQAFTVTDASGNVLAFYDQVNDPVKSYDAQGNLDVTLNETGYYTINGGDALAGTFDLSFAGNTSSGSTDNVGFIGTGEVFEPAVVGVTPEPTSILFLGTGLLGGAFMLRTRRRASDVI